jgi:hypothetical protein
MGSIQQSGFVQERAGHKSQGISPRLEYPVNLSKVSAPDVRYCQIKTTPCVEKKDLLEPDCKTVTLSDLECSGLAENGGWALWEGPSHGGGRESLVSNYLQSPDGTGQHAWLVE